MVVMSNTPFKESQRGNLHEQHSQGYPWDNRKTPRDIPGITRREYHAQARRRLGASRPGLACLEPPFRMEVAGTAAMPASPPGPGQDQLHTAWSRPDEMPKQMTHFRDRQGKQGSSIRSRITSRRGLDGKWRGSQGDVLGADPRQEGMCQHDQGDMAIPSDPASYFVLIQSHILSCFKVFLNMPACTDGLDHL